MNLESRPLPLTVEEQDPIPEILELLLDESESDFPEISQPEQLMESFAQTEETLDDLFRANVSRYSYPDTEKGKEEYNQALLKHVWVIQAYLKIRQEPDPAEQRFIQKQVLEDPESPLVPEDFQNLDECYHHHQTQLCYQLYSFIQYLIRLHVPTGINREDLRDITQSCYAMLFRKNSCLERFDLSKKDVKITSFISKYFENAISLHINRERFNDNGYRSQGARKVLRVKSVLESLGHEATPELVYLYYPIFYRNQKTGTITYQKVREAFVYINSGTVTMENEEIMDAVLNRKGGSAEDDVLARERARVLELAVSRIDPWDFEIFHSYLGIYRKIERAEEIAKRLNADPACPFQTLTGSLVHERVLKTQELLQQDPDLLDYYTNGNGHPQEKAGIFAQAALSPEDIHSYSRPLSRRQVMDKRRRKQFDVPHFQIDVSTMTVRELRSGAAIQRSEKAQWYLQNLAGSGGEL